jgi:hypothetical protein
MKTGLIAYHERRRYFISLLGGECKRCGSRKTLQFDHVQREHKSFNVSKFLTARIEVILSEIQKCQLLCRRCHKEKTDAELGIAEHGTESKYSHGCRCVACTETHRSYGREYARRNADRLNAQRRARRLEKRFSASSNRYEDS